MVTPDTKERQKSKIEIGRTGMGCVWVYLSTPKQKLQLKQRKHGQAFTVVSMSYRYLSTPTQKLQ